jgi:Fe-S cluster assembly ATP-binding protein
MLKLKNYTVENIFEDVSLTFEAGKTYIIMGSNGIGKSTLVHSLMGKPGLPTVSGSAIFLGSDINTLETDERARLGMFVGFQAPISIPGLSNFQFIKQATNIKVTEIKDSLDQFKELSNTLGLPDDWDKRNLNTDASGGERKKNELIQMLMMNTKLAMLDEPDSGLDVDGIKALTSELNAWRTEENTLVVITHYDKLISGLKPDAVIVLQKDGALVGDQSLADKIFNDGFEGV